jgi:hypothetical protein
MEDHGMESFTVSRSAIVHELLLCRDNKSAIGIWSSSLGKGMFMCFVKEVVMDEDEDDIVVILNESDFNSSAFETHVLYLYEIEKIFRIRVEPASRMNIQPR